MSYDLNMDKLTSIDLQINQIYYNIQILIKVENMTKSYELTCLISPDLSTQDLNSLSLRIKDFISQEKGVLEKETNPTKQNLGYPIKGKGEAFLLNLTFILNPEGLEKLEKELKEKKEILRYIILIKKPVKEIPIKIRKKPEKDFAEKREETKQSEKVELEKIDEKIEEILNE